MASFTYEGLEIDSNSPMIRLLSLLPGQYYDPIHCTLTIAYLSENPKYEALSYCWGNPDIVSTVYCNDMPVFVTTNLRDALRRLRSCRSPRVLWVDAICINQKDVDERSSQVPLMREIYSQCWQVVIWLGESDARSQEGFHLLERLSREGFLLPGVFTQRPEDLRHVSNFQVHGIPSFGSSEWDSFLSLILRPYFTRTWIVQELALAPTAIVLCGEHSANWDTFSFAVRLMHYMKAPAIFRNPHYGSFGSMIAAREWQQEGKSRRLFEVLMMFNHNLAKDPLDKIYGVLGIASDSGPDGLNIPVDYHLTPLELYHLFAIAMLKRNGNLEILSLPRPYPSSHTEGLPSWVPDWSQTELRRPCPLARNQLQSRTFLASRWTTYNPAFLSRKKRLVLEGMKFDKIKLVGEVMAPLHLEPMSFNLPNNVPNIPPGTGRSTVMAKVYLSWVWLTNFLSTTSSNMTKSNMMARIYLSWASLVDARSGSTYRTGDDMLDVYCQCIVAGCDPSKFERKRALFRNFFFGQKLLRATYLLCFLTPHYIFQFILLFLITGVTSRAGWFSPMRAREWDHTMVSARRIIKTRAGWVGLGPGIAEPGDRIVIVKGGDVPLVVRRKGEDWEFIGEIYVHGIMHGEEFDKDACERIELV